MRRRITQNRLPERYCFSPFKSHSAPSPPHTPFPSNQITSTKPPFFLPVSSDPHNIPLCSVPWPPFPAPAPAPAPAPFNKKKYNKNGCVTRYIGINIHKERLQSSISPRVACSPADLKSKLLHDSWQTGNRIFLCIFSDRVEIRFWGGITFFFCFFVCLVQRLISERA